MTKPTTKRNDRPARKHWDELFVISRDNAGGATGARFSQFDDAVVSAALARNYSVVYPASDKFKKAAKQLPLGSFENGEITIPKIDRNIFDRVTSILADTEDTSAIYSLGPIEILNDTPHPKTWDEVAVGSVVLIHENSEDGWYEAVVLERKTDILRLQLRDYPKLPTYERHINAVGLMNPNPLPHP